jgi:type IV pilus assembly protein PilY1
VPGQKVQYSTQTTTTTTQYSGGIQISQSVVPSTSALADLNGVCYTPGIAPDLPSILGLGAPGTVDAVLGLLPPALPSGCEAWPCTTSGSLVAGSENSLADVAQYYYVTDLRPELTDNVVPISFGPEDDRAKWQHMTTFVIALGVSGTIPYSADYKSAATGPYANLRSGALNWPTWPDPALNYSAQPVLYQAAQSIDDYWHAAVNGRGQYFSATNPSAVVSGLATTLSSINAQTGSGSAAAVSNPILNQSSNYSFQGSFRTVDWTGDVTARTLDPTTATPSALPVWSAASILNASVGAACDNRSIYLMRTGTEPASTLVPFTWSSDKCLTSSNLTPSGSPTTALNTAEKALFGATQVAQWSHYSSMTDGTLATADQRGQAAGALMVNFLRGHRGNEGFTTNVSGKLFRTRAGVLGDVVNGQPRYVTSPQQSYADAGYTAFKAANGSRTPMVYVPANDGMLHAFYAGTSQTDPLAGTEAWAVIPSSVAPNMYKLADTNYANIHTYFVDATPAVADIYDSAATKWRTVLVGGLGGGGKAIYALDVTDPASPQALWEFKWSTACYSQSNSATWGADCHLGYTFGQPLITKLSDGTWVAIFASGYNNVNSPAISGDGQGYIYVVNASTGTIIHKVATGSGTAASPAGLANLSAFVDNQSINNTALRVYGGDLLGNIWRLNLAGAPSTAPTFTLVGTATDSAGVPQPITTSINLAELNGSSQFLFVGTGRLLGSTDLTSTQTQSVYGIIDTLSSTTVYSSLRAGLAPQQISGTGSTTRTASCTGTSSQCAAVSTTGWVVDLPNPGERVNRDMNLQSGTISFASNLPSSSACSGGGTGFITSLSALNGLAVPGSTGISTAYNNTLVVGLSVVLAAGQLYALPTGGTPSTSVLTGTQLAPLKIPTAPAPPVGKRVSWREL